MTAKTIPTIDMEFITDMKETGTLHTKIMMMLNRTIQAAAAILLTFTILPAELSAEGQLNIKSSNNYNMNVIKLSTQVDMPYADNHRQFMAFSPLLAYSPALALDRYNSDAITGQKIKTRWPYWALGGLAGAVVGGLLGGGIGKGNFGLGGVVVGAVVGATIGYFIPDFRIPEFRMAAANAASLSPDRPETAGLTITDNIRSPNRILALWANRF